MCRGIMGQHLVRDCEPDVVPDDAARKGEQLVLLTFQASANRSGTAFRGIPKIVEVYASHAGVEAGFGCSQGIGGIPAKLLELGQKAIRRFGKTTQSRHKEFLELAPSTVIDHATQFSA